MRTRWRVNDDWLKAVLVGWYGGGLVALFTFVFACRDHDRQGNDTGVAWVHSPLHWFLPVYLLSIALPVAAIFAGPCWHWVRHNPPVRRVRESVPDMRAVHKKHDE